MLMISVCRLSVYAKRRVSFWFSENCSAEDVLGYCSSFFFSFLFNMRLLPSVNSLWKFLVLNHFYFIAGHYDSQYCLSTVLSDNFFYIIIASITTFCTSSFIHLLLAWPLQGFLSSSHVLATF